MYRSIANKVYAASGKLALLALLGVTAFAQTDPVERASRALTESTDNQFRFTFDERTRWEERTGVNFGQAVDQQDGLVRIRIGAQYEPTEWFKISAMGQDSRVPFYGLVAPNTMRDTMDLQEGYIELFGHKKTGFGAMFGRKMVSYGEGRLIGIPDWTNVSRTYDLGRAYYRTSRGRFEILMVSPVKVRTDDFNTPDLGERIWGTYNTFSSVWRGASFDAYALRHSQNKIGGWTGTATLGTNSFGGRFYGPLPHSFRYSFEGIGQTGKMGTLDQRAYAWYSSVGRKVTVANKPLDLVVEYKGASGTRYGSTNSGTFDQLAPANHDKFGHEDLFGWRNIVNARAVASLSVTKRLAVNLMYDDTSLMQKTDFLYNGSGKGISRSITGTAGRHVGQELDSFITYKRGVHTFGAGFGHFFKGEFVQNTTPGINPRYLYVYQQYSF